MKKATLILAATLMFSSSVYAQEKPIDFYVNFEKTETVVPIIEKNGTVYISLRDITDSDTQISWFDDNKSAYIVSKDLLLKSGSAEIKNTEKVLTMSAPAELIDSRLMVPIDGAELLIKSTEDVYMFDAENKALYYTLPVYEFKNGNSDYYFAAKTVDFKNGEAEELRQEIIKNLDLMNLYSENNDIVLKSIEETSEGNGEVVFSVTGENPREISAEIRNNTAVKIHDPYTLPIR